jgi:hypothetical protein
MGPKLGRIADGAVTRLGGFVCGDLRFRMSIQWLRYALETVSVFERV